MALNDLGNVPASSVLPLMFTSHAASTGAMGTLSNLAVGDILVYKGTSMTQRSSTAGFALIDTDGIDLDTLSGVNGVSIDLSDNTDAGFYAVGSFYNVILGPVTIDAQTMYIHLATFRIVAAESVTGKPKVDVDAWLGTAAATPSTAGVPAVDVVRVANTVQTAGDIIGDTNDIQTRLPAALTADGNMKADTLRVGGTLQTAGDIIGDTNDIQTRLPAALVGGRMASNAEVVGDKTGYALSSAGVQAIWDALTTALTTVGSIGKRLADNIDAQLSVIAGYVDTEVAAIKAKTDNLPAAPAAVGDIPTAAANANAVWDATLAAHTTAGSMGANQNLIDDINTAIAALNNISAAQVNAEADTAIADALTSIADAILDRAAAVEGYTPRQLLRLFAAVLVGKADGLATTTAHYRDVADTKNRITATVDADGNRTAVTLDAT